MKFDCEIIQDLLPLYIDDVCSIKSKAIVEEHVTECSNCKELLDELDELLQDGSGVQEIMQASSSVGQQVSV